MLSNPNSATSKSPDRDHERYSIRPHAGSFLPSRKGVASLRPLGKSVGVLCMSNGVPKFLRLKNLEELGARGEETISPPSIPTTVLIFAGLFWTAETRRRQKVLHERTLRVG